MNMQQHKVTNNNSELEIIVSNSEKLVSSLTEVLNKFQFKRNVQMFDFLKSKGIAVSSLLSILLILPFYGFANIYQLMKYGIDKLEIECKKTTFYQTKNNEFIDWRALMMLHVKRFIYLINNNINLKSNNIKAIIFDDTTIEKTGKKIEKVSAVFDHVTHRFILGYKLLVCGFWDGDSFIPHDFTLHREKGTKHQKFINQYNNSCKDLEKSQKELQKVEKKLEQAKNNLQKKEEKLLVKLNKINQLSCEKLVQKIESLEQQKKKFQQKTEAFKEAKRLAYNTLKGHYMKGRLYGLTAKERKEQFRKAVSSKSHGFKRRKEADKSKIDSMLTMLCRVVKSGILPDYVLVDSWFFCYELLAKLQALKKGAIKLVSMVKIHNQLFTICQTNKELSIKAIIKLNERTQKRCKKYNAHYVRVNCLYKGIRVNLFFVKMGKSGKWHLLLTTDLELNFVKLMEIYQIRWSIEVFFKESKQYLNLSNCHSNTYDAQIADITISMMQYIMLTYFKRVNYQQSIGGLFKSISAETVELNLVKRLLSLFVEMVELLCNLNGIDFIEFQQNIMKDEKIMEKFNKLLPQKVINNAA